MGIEKTNAINARRLAQEITEAIGADNAWNENTSVWWSNIFNIENGVNAFFSQLTNMVISQRVKSLEFENPLAQYKNGELALGIGEAEIYINPQTGKDFYTFPEETYNDANTNNGLLLDKLPDVQEVFYRINYGKQYKVTYSELQLRQVMTSWENFASFIDGISRNLNASANIDEYNAMRQLFVDGFNNGFIPQTEISAPTDAATANALLVKAREYFLSFPFPSTQYNGWSLVHPSAPVTTWSEKDKISIMLSARAAAVVDVEALAMAFNIEKAEFLGKVQIVDKIDTEGKIFAVLFDDTLINVKPQIDLATQFYNPETLKQNFNLTRTGIMSLSPFSNSIAFTTYNYTLLTAQPTDWATNYTNYYTKSGNSYAQISGSVAPEFTADTYYSRS